MTVSNDAGSGAGEWRSAGHFRIVRRFLSAALEEIAWANLGEGTTARISGDGEDLYIVADETGEEIIVPVAELTLVADDEGLELRRSGRPILVLRSDLQPDYVPPTGWYLRFLNRLNRRLGNPPIWEGWPFAKRMSYVPLGDLLALATPTPDEPGETRPSNSRNAPA